MRPSRLCRALCLVLNLTAVPALLPAMAAAATASPAAPTPSAARPARLEPFERAYAFASALDCDLNDKGQAQEAVVLEIGTYVSVDEALRRADAVEGWRRGVVYAELAALLAKEQRAAEARRLIERGEAFRGTVQGWPNARIGAHLANAAAALGEVESAETEAARFAAGDRQYNGRPAATAAAALAAAGRHDEAFAKLKPLDGSKDQDEIWWRTMGYVEIGRRSSGETRARALAAAVASASDVPGWRSAEARELIARELRLAGLPERARAVLGDAEAVVRAQSDAALPVKGPLMAALAREWARLGEKDRARRLLVDGEAVVPSAILIERPVIYADLAAGAHVLGDPALTARYYDRALALTEALLNGRPRALAAVEICRSLGREDVPLDAATRARLDALFKGLKAPW